MDVLGPCGQPVRGAVEPCVLESGHKGTHAQPLATFTCDGCGRVCRGQPYRSGRPLGWSDEEFGLCFPCVKAGERDYRAPMREPTDAEAAAEDATWD